MGQTLKNIDPTCIQSSRLLMGSLIKITLYGEERDQSSLALEDAFAEVKRLEDLLSPFKNESELSIINRQAGSGWVKTDPELVSLIHQSLSFSRLTQGAFDMTIGPLMRLWGFRSDRNLTQVPSKDQIHNVLGDVGYRKVMVDQASSSTRYDHNRLEIEFGAFGKGYAIDRAIETIKNNGIGNALISFGSTTYALGHPPDEEGWRVGIQHPREAEQILDIVTLSNQAISTSGDYEQGVWIEGQRYNHIIDPRTGRPTQGLCSVSVIADTAIKADVLSTGILVLGQTEGMRLLARSPLTMGHFVTEGRPGTLEINRSDG